MPLTAEEQRIIERLVDSQLRLERMMGSMMGGTLGSVGVNLWQRDVLDSPLILDRQERIDLARKTARVSKAAGKKTRRKVSGYQKEFGIQLKKLKKKHPRTKIGTLMKRAHKATKKVRR